MEGRIPPGGRDTPETVRFACRVCGEPAEARARFCIRCGRRLDRPVYAPEQESFAPPPVLCTRCGAPLRKGTDFCEQCGAGTAESFLRCPKCGLFVDPVTKICRVCGASAEGAAAQKGE